MPDQDDKESRLFDRFGGADGLASIVRDMYDRVLADPELSAFFENTPMERLQKMQLQFLASALDGPVNYTGAELNAIHRGRGITGQHFASFCSHFADAAEAADVSAKDVDAALGRLSTYKDKITGTANVDG